jgi:galactofuranosylgalactofuranosylrhamnosyl-N-acetylglucosaminyl-diphospho-decaprenol beta-1,5/1,6-galactofuranosyltransferase
MQYATVELRHRALEDVLAGPYSLHGQLPGKLAEVRTLMTQFSDMQLKADRDDLPPVRRDKPAKKGKDDVEIPGRLSQLVTAALAPLRQLRPVRSMAREFPETDLTAMDAMWYRLARFDSAVVSMNDGTSAALYQRDPEKFRDLMRRTVEIHQQLHREWPRLAEEYRAALADITSPAAWEDTFRPWTEGEDG